MTRNRWSQALTVTLSTVAICTGSTLAADARPTGIGHCDPDARPVVLVHDLVETADSWSSLTPALTDAGHCVVTVTWGRPSDGDLPLPTAGVRGVDAGADDLSAALDNVASRHPRPVDIVAHGVGALVVQRYLQNEGPAAVRSLTTLGPLWNGTEIGRLAAMEQFSRDIGTYDLVLSLEKPILDPVCAGCREIIRGSDLLRDLHARGLPTPGVRYTDIVSECDILVVPTATSTVDGATVHLLQQHDPGSCTPHGLLPHDPIVHDLTIRSLAAHGV